MVRVHGEHLPDLKKKKLENVCSTRTPQFNLDVKQQNYIRCLQTVEISVNTLGAIAGINKTYIFKRN